MEVRGEGVNRSGQQSASNPLVSLPAARLHLVSESPELRAPNRTRQLELKPINNPPARPTPHPICLLIPSADDDELQDLTDDIRAHGLIDPIVLFEGMILETDETGRPLASAPVSLRTMYNSEAAEKTL